MIEESSVALPQTESFTAKAFLKNNQSTVIKADSVSQKTASSFCAVPSEIPQGFIINCAPPTHCSLWDVSAVTGSVFLTGSVPNRDRSGKGNVFPRVFLLYPYSPVSCSPDNFLLTCFYVLFYIFPLRFFGGNE